MAVGQDGVLAEFQHLSHRGSRFLFRLLVGVDVDVQRGRNIGVTEKFLNLFNVHSLRQKQASCRMPLRYNNDKQKKPLFSRGLSVCRLLFNSFSKLKIDENYKEKRRLFY